MEGDRREATVTAQAEAPSAVGKGSRVAPGPNLRGIWTDRLWERLGLAVPCGWWPSVPLLKSFEAAGFSLTQIPSPPASVLSFGKGLGRHARGALEGLESSGLAAAVHAPPGLLAGSRDADRALEGLLAYAVESGAEHVVYHAHAFADGPASEDLVLNETRSLARLAARAERLDVTIAVENLAPVYPGPEQLSHTPMTLRSLVQRIGSERLGICLDLGHAQIVADLKHTTVDQLIQPVLDAVVLFHAHDNFGARLDREAPAGIDPLRLDLHLSPGQGTLPWANVAPLLALHPAPVLLEIHPPRRPPIHELHRSTLELLTPSLALT